MTRTKRTLVAALLLLPVFTGCGSAIKSAGIRLLYREASAPPRVLVDVPYRPGSSDAKQRLDLFLPAGSGWPVIVFVHGGGWDGGDKDLLIAGADVYGNIGRFYSSRGIGAAIINYRLQPEATWRDQVDDVAHAVAWVRSNVGRYGGDRRAVFLSGHSAGAQLVAYVALDPSVLAGAGAGVEPATALCGVIPVSGAAYDMTDEETYERGADREYLERRFRLGETDGNWMRSASAMTYLSPAAPPFLILHGSLEWKALAYQNLLLDRALRAAGVASRLEVFAQFHQSMVLALARQDQKPAQAVLAFIRGTPCGEGGSALSGLSTVP